jgi:hypothetical protein
MISKEFIKAIAFSFLCLVGCREQVVVDQSGAEEQLFGGILSDLLFCREHGGDGRCMNSREIVLDASSIARRSNVFASDPCDTDGQRDAFRHIYSMVWITAIYGDDFAKVLGDHRDPPPREGDDSQAICEQGMDRHNNNIGRQNSASIMLDCDVSAGNNFDAYTSYQSDVSAGKLTECVESRVRDLIATSSDTSEGSAVVIERDPKNSRNCWLVPGNKTVAPRGRTLCDE